MSKKTSTAALESFCKRRLTNRRRAPRHPASGRRKRNNKAKTQRSNERAGEFGQAQIMVRQGGAVNGNKVSGAAGKLRVILPVILRITFCLLMWTLGAMTMTIAEAQTEDDRVVPQIPVGSARVENSRRPVEANHNTYYRSLRKAYARLSGLRSAPMTSTKNKAKTPQLTSRAALTTLPGAVLSNRLFRERSPVQQPISGRVVASI